MTPIRIAILTVSDRCSCGETTDTSGPALARIARTCLHADFVATACVPDERSRLGEQLRHWALRDPRPDLILTTGGTGLAPRDLTPEATLDVLERRHTGLMELIRLRCSQKTPRAYLSRGEAGTLGRTLIINLPGSERGATESLEALVDILLLGGVMLTTLPHYPTSILAIMVIFAGLALARAANDCLRGRALLIVATMTCLIIVVNTLTGFLAGCAVAAAFFLYTRPRSVTT